MRGNNLVYQVEKITFFDSFFALGVPNNSVVQISDEDFNKLRPKGNFNERKKSD